MTPDRIAHEQTAPAARRTQAVRLTATAFIGMLMLATFEGAIRKWISPAFTLPLVAIRDLLAIGVIALALRDGPLLRRSGITLTLMAWSALVIGWGLLQVVFANAGLLVFLVGVRFWLLYVWFGVAAGLMLDAEGFRRVLKASLYLVIVMTPLAVVQHFAPPFSFINKQIGSDVDKVFLVAEGVVRVTGTFSFTLGFATLLAVLLPATMLGVLEYRRLKLSGLLALAALVAMLVCTAVSGSRAALVFFAVMAVFAVIIGLYAYRGVAKSRSVVFAVIGFFAVLGVVTALPSVVTTMQERIAAASQSGSVQGRIAVIFLGDADSGSHFTWLGAGIGAGSNLGSFLQTGQRGFTFGEAETGRNIVEGGLLGDAYVLLKLGVTIVGLLAATLATRRTRSCFPLLTWIGLAVAIITWESTLQLTVQAMLGIFLAMGVFSLRSEFGRVFQRP